MARIINSGDLTPAALQALPQHDLDCIYNGLDCCVTLEVLEVLLGELDETSSETYAFSRALQGPIIDMAMRGIRIDFRKRDMVLAEFEARREKVGSALDRIIREGIGVDIDWNSPKQLMNLFYDVMQFKPIRKRNPKGMLVPTINRDAIEKLQSHYYAGPLCAHLLLLRDLNKKIGFLKTGIDPDGRIRAGFNIAGTTTGRLSSSMSEFGTGTNLQNVDRDLKKIFIADPGYKFVNLDLEQGDSRNVGAIIWNLFYESHGATEAGKYLDACESGDLHTTVCSMAWSNLPWPGDAKGNRDIADGIAYRNFSYRDLAKKLGHGSNYLGQPKTMAGHSKVEQPLIEDFQDRYFGAFPLIGSTYGRSHEPNWHNWVKQQIWDFGYITSLMGRRRFFYGNPADESTLREAVAYEPQSLTGDEINTGMLRIWRQFSWVQLLCQVHDSILLQVPEEMSDDVIQLLLDTLRITLLLKGGREFSVPTEAKVGWNWGDAPSEKEISRGAEPNPDGMIKWKGADLRRRTEHPIEKVGGKLTLRGIL